MMPQNSELCSKHTSEPPLEFCFEKPQELAEEINQDNCNVKTVNKNILQDDQTNEEKLAMKTSSPSDIEHYYIHNYNDDIFVILNTVYDYFDKLKRDDLLPLNSAVVFDIDDTLISTSPVVRQEFLRHFANEIGIDTDSEVEGFTPPVIIPHNFFPPIQQVCRFYYYIKGLGLKTLLLTGRSEETRDITISNLKWVGITNWDDLVLRNLYEKNLPASSYKSNRRATWANEYFIIANIGDQYSDLSGAYSGYTIKLPNLMYKIH